MTLTMCVLTVLAINWRTSEVISVPTVVPCTGYDHVVRLEIITTHDPTEFHALQHVIQSQLDSSSMANSMSTTGAASGVYGPARYGRHYESMLRERKSRLSHRRNTRLISVTERVHYDAYGSVDHLFNRMSVSSYNIHQEKHTTQTNVTLHEKPSVTSRSEVIVPPAELVVPYLRPVHPVRIRKRRVADVVTEVKSEVRVDNNNERNDSSRVAKENTSNGGGYGSSTCMNSDVSSWNNNTFTNGACECGSILCPPCEIGSLMQMLTEVRAERRQTQDLLNTCLQDKPLQQSSPKLQPSRRNGGSSCNHSEIRRLKEEARTLRARMRRMADVTAGTVTPPGPAPLKSSLTSSLETIGSTIAQTVVERTAERVSTLGSRNIAQNGVQSLSSTGVTTATLSPTKSTQTSRSKVNPFRQKLKNMVSRSKVGSSRKNRGTESRVRNHKNPRKSNRSRRETLEELANRLEPLLSQQSTLDLRHQPFKESHYSTHVGDEVQFRNPRPRKTGTSRRVDKVKGHWKSFTDRSRVRKTRDVTNSHFMGATNNAHAFTKSNFIGSTENRTDNSNNVRNFHPRISPKIDLSAHGANETIIHESNNGNEIKITNAPPCICDVGDSFDFKTLLWSIWLQVCISLLLALGFTIHYHLQSQSKRRKRKDAIEEEQIRIRNQFIPTSNRTGDAKVITVGANRVEAEIASESTCAIVV